MFSKSSAAYLLYVGKGYGVILTIFLCKTTSLKIGVNADPRLIICTTLVGYHQVKDKYQI